MRNIGKSFPQNRHKMIRDYSKVLFSILVLFLSQEYVICWGINGHKIISRSLVYHLPQSLNTFIAESLYFETHSYDPEYRIVEGSTYFYAEWTRHHFYIDDYPNFRNLSRNLDTLIRLYGINRVRGNGLNPWITVRMLDYLVDALITMDESWLYFANNIAHYVADAHQPLRCTYNYNGQVTGNYDIFKRYEIQLINLYDTLLTIQPTNVQFISSPIDYIFSYIYHSHSRVDSILKADNYAKRVANWDGVGTAPPEYFTVLWEKTQRFTSDQFQRASIAIANLWYTAWIRAGLGTNAEEFTEWWANNFILEQNYPNPFNHFTIINYQLKTDAYVTLKIYDMLGREVKTLVNEFQRIGKNSVEWDASDVSSGVYIYQITVGDFSDTKKMILEK